MSNGYQLHIMRYLLTARFGYSDSDVSLSLNLNQIFEEAERSFADQLIKMNSSVFLLTQCVA